MKTIKNKIFYTAFCLVLILSNDANAQQSVKELKNKIARLSFDFTYLDNFKRIKKITPGIYITTTVDSATIEQIKNIDVSTLELLFKDKAIDYKLNKLLYFAYEKEATILSTFGYSKNDWRTSMKKNDLDFWKLSLTKIKATR